MLVFICVLYNICILYLSYGGRVESEVWRGRGGSKRYNRQAAVSYNGQQGCLTMGRAYAITPLQVIQVIRTHTHTHTHSFTDTQNTHTHTRDQREWVFKVREVKSENKKLSLFFEKCKVKKKCFHSFSRSAK